MPNTGDIIRTAQELRAMVRATAKLPTAWEQASQEMKAWYIMLARRAEGIEESLQ